jgi:hypothetical protein
VLVAASPAAAAIMLATYTGSVLSGVDNTNLFGFGHGAGLTGKAFTATFLYDTEAGLDNGDPGYYEERGGGSAWGLGVSNPILAATLTINSVAYEFSGDLTSRILSSTAQSLERAEGMAGGGYNMLWVYLNHAAPGDLEAAVPTTGGSLSGGQFNLNNAGGSLANGTLRASTLTIAAAPVAGVPEPAAWALLILGFGGVGGLLRDTRRRAAA